MKTRKHRSLSALMVLAMLVSLLPFDTGIKAKAAENGYINTWCSFEDKSGDINYFYMLTPEKEGSYPLVVYFPGLGGVYGWSSYSQSISQWTEQGLIEPVVFVMPVLNTYSPYDHRSKEYIDFVKTTRYGGDEYKPYIDNGKFLKLIDSLKTGDFTNEALSDRNTSYTGLGEKIDFSKDMTVSGLSMGGAISLYAGVKHRDIIKNVGALSPALTFYPYEGYKDGFIQYADDIIFTDDPNAKLFMGYGLDEEKGSMMFKNNVNRYQKAVKTNEKNSNSFVIYETVGEHELKTFTRELFVFLRYLQKGEILTDKDNKAFIAEACGDYDHTGLDEGTVTKEAACDTAGEKTYKCAYCKTDIVKEIPALGHDYEVTETGQPDCTHGVTLSEKCRRCNKVTSKTIPALGHDWDEGITENGTVTYTCKRCSAKYSESAPLCAHKWDDGKYTKKVTCTENGIITYTCTICQENKTETLPASGHFWNEGETSQDGTVTYTCLTCGAVSVETPPIHEHIWDEGKVTKEPSEKAKGEKTFTCKVCGETKTEEIPPNTVEYAPPLGDVNGDYVIDIEDAVMVISHINGTSALTKDQMKRADIDGNKDIAIEDAVAIIAHVNGIKSIA